MKFSGEYLLPASRAEVWAALNDITVLQRAIPGCSDFSANGVNSYQAVIESRIGPVKSSFRTDITVTDLVEPESYRLVVTGSGGAQGMGAGETCVHLVEQGDQTSLHYDVELKVRGKLAQVGSRLLSNAIKKISDQFFANIRNHFDK